MQEEKLPKDTLRLLVDHLDRKELLLPFQRSRRLQKLRGIKGFRLDEKSAIKDETMREHLLSRYFSDLGVQSYLEVLWAKKNQPLAEKLSTSLPIDKVDEEALMTIIDAEELGRVYWGIRLFFKDTPIKEEYLQRILKIAEEIEESPFIGRILQKNEELSKEVTSLSEELQEVKSKTEEVETLLEETISERDRFKAELIEKCQALSKEERLKIELNAERFELRESLNQAKATCEEHGKKINTLISQLRCRDSELKKEKNSTEKLKEQVSLLKKSHDLLERENLDLKKKVPQSLTYDFSKALIDSFKEKESIMKEFNTYTEPIKDVDLFELWQGWINEEENAVLKLVEKSDVDISRTLSTLIWREYIIRWLSAGYRDNPL